MSLEVAVDGFADAFIALLAVAATLIGVWFANNYQRQMKIKLADGRRQAYARLWAVTGLAAPTRLFALEQDGPLTLKERQDLHEAMTDWYYDEGNGMLLARGTRQVFLNAKNNLVCTDRSDLKPDGLDKDLPARDDEESLDEEQLRGILSIKQLSLLRTQLKADLAIHGDPYTGKLTEHERRFLAGSGIDLGSETWAGSSGWNHRFHRMIVWGGEIADRVKVPKAFRDQETQWESEKRQSVNDEQQQSKENKQMAEDEEAPTGKREWYKPQQTLNIGTSHAVPTSARDAVAQRTGRPPSTAAQSGQDPTG